jgi:hypothetical protein
LEAGWEFSQSAFFMPSFLLEQRALPSRIEYSLLLFYWIGIMYQRTPQMEPLLPSGSPDLEDTAREIVSHSAALGGQLHPVTRDSV